jgi:hypothetical protein
LEKAKISSKLTQNMPKQKDFRFRHTENSRQFSSFDKNNPKDSKFPIQNSKITTEVEGKHNWKGKSIREPTKP